MRRSWILAVAAAGLIGCHTPPDPVHFAHLSFEMPGDWTHKDETLRGIATTVWTPEANDHKESITIIRSSLAGAAAQADSSTVGRLLVGAEAGLPRAKMSDAVAVVTQSGLFGVRVDGDYVPPGTRDRYHRVHVVLFDGARASLVHVLYTAKEPDPSQATLKLVLATIREREG